MRTRVPLAWAMAMGVGMPVTTTAQQDGARRPIDPATAAKLPAPGTVAPGAFGFTPDGRAVTYLKAESASLSRALWRAGLDGSAPRVVARAPGGGDTDANVSREEALRRERQRLRETGITQIQRAAAAEVAVVPIRGDLYLLRGADGALERITEADGPEIDPKLDAEGRRVAFVRGGELHCLDLATKAETQLSRGAVDGLSHGVAEFMAQEEMGRSTGFWWSPDGSRIAYQEADERHIASYPIVHQGGGEVSVENHRYPFPGTANARVRLGVVPAAGGETRWLKLPVDTDDFYLARVDWDGPKSLLVQILDRAQSSLRLHRIDVDAGTSSPLIEERSNTWVNLHDDLRVVEGTGEIVWTSEATGFRHIQLRDRDGKLIRTLTDGNWPVDAVEMIDSKRREVWFSAGIASPLERHLHRVSLDGGDRIKVTTEPGTHRVAVAKDGDAYVDTVSSLDRPPITRLVARDGRAISELDDAAKSDPRVGELALVPPEILPFRGRGGAELYGAYYAPRSDAFGPTAPIVVMLYGGPHVQYVSNAWNLTADLNAQMLAGRGFAVWKMDNRGSSRRGLAFESAISRNMGSVEVRDQVDGVRFLASGHPGVDPARVGVTGSSYGGYMTLRCLTEAPEVFRAGVAVAPVTDWDGYDTCYTERYMGTPADNPTGYRTASVLSRVERIRGDLLIVHGMIDENVHFRHSARLASALIAAGKPFRLLPLPEERHSSRKEEGRAYVAGQLLDFFAASLATVPNPGAERR